MPAIFTVKVHASTGAWLKTFLYWVFENVEDTLEAFIINVNVDSVFSLQRSLCYCT